MPYGTGLDSAFNQDEPTQNINTHPKKVKTPEGLEKQVDYDKIQHLKVGEMVAYTKGQGTIVRKDGAYVTIFNEDAGAYDQVHAGETYIPGDTISMGIMNQLWDQMNYETRMASLHKAEVQEPLHFVDRKWNELPSNLKEVIQKKSPKYVSVGSGYKGPNVPSSAKVTGPGGSDAKPTKRRSDPKKLGTGDTATGAGEATTGQSRSSKPGNKVMTNVAGQKVQVTERQRKLWESNTTPEQRGDKTFTTDYGNKLTGKPSGAAALRQSESYKPNSATSGPGTYVGGKKISGPGVKTTKPKETPKPAENKVQPSGSGPSGPTGNKTTTSAGDAAATAAAARSTGSRPTGRKDPGAGTFAQGLSKATSYGEAAVEIYKLRNQLNKQFLGGKEDPFDKKLIGGSKKSDVEHGAYGGVVTDTPFDATEDYEEKRPKVQGKEFDHNHQQKTPRDPKEEGKEVLVGYHSKEGGAISTGTAGANNAVYDEKDRERSIRNKYNSRYGV
jgi:hypothetical protein